MKKLLLIICTIFGTTCGVKAAEFRIGDMSKGMYSNFSANKIPDNAASSIVNFYSDIQGMLVERNGYFAVDSSLGGGNTAVTGAWRFLDNSGNEWLISFSNRTFYKHTVGNVAASFGPTMTSDNQVYAASNLGKIWFTNGVDSVWWFDGTSTGAVSGAPLGRLIVAFRNRIAIADIVGNRSTIRFSADGDGTSWTLAGNPTDPFETQIGGANDGQFIKCLAIYQDNLIAGRKRDMWYLAGFDQEDILSKNISTEVGCSDQGSIQEWDGSLMWLSNRGIEEMKGLSIEKVSEPIRDITDVLVKNTANQRSATWTEDTDWEAGGVNESYFYDTDTTPGKILFTFPDNFTNFRDGTSGTKAVWTKKFATFGGLGTGDVVPNGSVLTFSHNGAAASFPYIKTTDTIRPINAGTTYYFGIDTMDAAGSGNVSNGFMFLISTMSLTGTTVESGNTPSSASGVSLVVNSSETGKGYVRSIGVGGAFFASCTGACSAQASFPHVYTVYVEPTLVQVSRNGVILVRQTGLTPPTSGLRNSPLYAYFASANQSGIAATSNLDFFNVFPQSFTWISDARTVGSAITSWNPIRITDTQAVAGNATINYAIAGGATSSTSTYTNWTTITNGTKPTISTSAFVAVRATFTTTSNSLSIHPVLEDITVNWQEGAAPATVSTTYDGRYWLGCTTDLSGSPYNNKVLVYQRNRTWTTFSGINPASFAIWRDKLHFGSANTVGKIYEFDTGNNDAGSAITSEAVFKSFDFSQLHRDKDFRNIYLSYAASQAFSEDFDLSFFVDGTTTEFPLGTALMSEGEGQTVIKFPFNFSTGPTNGRELQLRISKSGSGDRLKLYDAVVEYSVKEPQ